MAQKIMKRLTFSVVLLSLSISVFAQKPKVVVGIVIDQMRQDYLYRFENKFSEGGFKRLLKEGYSFKNAHYNYIPTYTAPGHASIYTGTTPSNHGIISNSWFDKVKEITTYCVFDGTVSAVGGNERNGRMSPRNLKASTITDELMLTSNFRSKVVGVSIKDRGSILPAGHNPTGAYWFDSNTGKFMTSTYYSEKLPDWVDSFNKRRLPNQYLSQTWTTLEDIEKYKESSQDDAPYEVPFKGQDKAVFPYDLAELAKDNGVGLIRTTPFGNQLVLDMGLAAIEGAGLGEDSITDFLAISFSSTDYVGHAFGPYSIELQDTYLRLDLEIKRLLDYLDERFGNDYMLFLSADHGVVEVPLFLEDTKMVGGYLDLKDLEATIKQGLKDRFGNGNWIKSLSNDQVFLDHDLLRDKGIDPLKMRRYLKELLLTVDGVNRVYTADELTEGNATDMIKQRFENGFNMKMSGDLAISLTPGYLINSGYGKAGTTHGSGYTYDTHVPIIFFGSHIRKGTSVRKVAVTDIAPTLSMLLDISLPSSCTGLPLKELFDNE